jgi:hypothetical protein
MPRPLTGVRFARFLKMEQNAIDADPPQKARRLNRTRGGDKLPDTMSLLDPTSAAKKTGRAFARNVFAPCARPRRPPPLKKKRVPGIDLPSAARARAGAGGGGMIGRLHGGYVNNGPPRTPRSWSLHVAGP